MERNLYEFLERADVLGRDTILLVTSRQPIKRDLEHMRNNGFDVDLDVIEDKTQARIRFKNIRQMTRFTSMLKIHKLWDQRAIDFVNAVRRGVEAGVER